MADTEARHLVGSQLNSLDGGVYIYAQASVDLTKGTHVDLNINRRLSIWTTTSSVMFPWGVVTEDVKKEEYTFVMVQPPKVKKPEAPVVG